MLPTFNDGDIVLSESFTSRSGKIGSGNLVNIRTPFNPELFLAKRVKGVEGDVVSYLVDPNKSDEQKTTTVPKGHLWIEGDNTYKSYDSRNFGPVPYALLDSRIFFVIWPREKFGLIEKKAP